MSELKVTPEKAKEMQGRAKERNLILQEMKNLGPSTVQELSNVTGIESEKLLRHLIAMRQFGQVTITGQRNKHVVFALVEEK
jgi:predicted ArsR family transcriptional regulator